MSLVDEFLKSTNEDSSDYESSTTNNTLEVDEPGEYSQTITASDSDQSSGEAQLEVEDAGTDLEGGLNLWEDSTQDSEQDFETSTGDSSDDSGNSTSENNEDNADNQTTNSSDFAKEVVELTNQERSEAGLEPLEWDANLAEAADHHSENMASKDFFSHTGADGSSPFERIEEAGYDYSTAGENIAVGQQTPEAVVDSWMGSSGHRANILSPDFTEIGVGYESLANDTGDVNFGEYWTQNFGTPVADTAI